MKNKTKVIYALFLAILLQAFWSEFAMGSSSQSISGGDSSSMMRFKGKVIDTNVMSLPDGKTEVKIFISKNPFNRFNAKKLPHHLIQVTVKYNEPFEVMVPMPANIVYISISYTHKVASGHWQDAPTNIYMLLRGDEISCELDNNIFSFSGRGSDKLNCQSKIHKINVDWDEAMMRNASSREYVTLYNTIDKKIDSCANLRQMILDSYKDRINKNDMDILVANGFAYKYYNLIKNERVFAKSNPDIYKAFISSKLYSKILKLTIPNKPVSELTASPMYSEFVFEYIMIKTRQYVNGTLEENSSPSHMKRVYDNIMTNYHGIIRSKLLANFFLHWHVEPGIPNFYNLSLNQKLTSDHDEIVEYIMSKNFRNPDFYPFELQNEIGQTVKLEDFGDDVVVLDFWYSGCLACADFKKAMEPILEKFRNRANLHFMTISIDKDRSGWLKSIRSGLYTDSEAINLYTNGDGKSHPLIIHQGITSFPRCFIIRKGKVIVPSVPYPDSSLTLDQISSMIEDALKL